MGAASLAETSQQDCIGCFEEDDFRRNHPPNRLQHLGELSQLRAFADVNDESSPPDIPRLNRQLGKPGNQFDRQIIDAVVAEVFERFQHRRFSRTAHARDDHEFGRPAR